MERIYILKLENDKYYVGRARNIKKIYQDHLKGVLSPWTKKHRPISIIEEISNVSYFDEDKYVKEYMYKYGIENVRGGSYTSIELNDISIITLRREISGRYGKNSHFAKDYCTKVKEVPKDTEDIQEDSYSSSSSYEFIVWYCEFCNKEFDTKRESVTHEDMCHKRTMFYMD
jgi:predicted GIY-YIG superfamily endonuclease